MMLVADSTVFSTSFLPKFGLTTLTTNNQSVLQAWVLGATVSGVRAAASNYYFLISKPSSIESATYTDVMILFLDTTGETITVKSETKIKTSSLIDVLAALEDYFKTVV